MSDETKSPDPPNPSNAEDLDESNDRQPLPRFRLKHGTDIDEIEARDAVEAVALFNDKRAKWPNPREVTVEQL